MERFNAAVIGAGGMGKVHVEAALASPYVKELYVVDPDPERIKLWQGGIPAEKCFYGTDPQRSVSTFCYCGNSESSAPGTRRGGYEMRQGRSL